MSFHHNENRLFKKRWIKPISNSYFNEEIIMLRKDNSNIDIIFFHIIQNKSYCNPHLICYITIFKYLEKVFHFDVMSG